VVARAFAAKLQRLSLPFLAPLEHPQSSESVPPARLTDRFSRGQRNGLFIGAIKDPSTVRLAPVANSLQSVIHTRVVTARISEVVERAENVVMVARRKRELEKLGIRDFASREPAIQTAFEKVLLASFSSGGDLRRGPCRTFELK